jgi:outer membrane protein assembly factor BamB
MNISKLLPLFLTIFIISGCDKNRNTVKQIIDFTPKLHQETDTQNISLDQPLEVRQWNGSDFLNQVPSNFAIKDLNFAFQKSKMSLSGEITAAPIIKDDLLFVLDSKNNVTCYDLKLQSLQWQTSLNLGLDKVGVFFGGLTLFDDRLYITNNSQELIVLEAATGYQLSRLKLNDILLNPVTVDENGIYLLTASNQIIALKKNDLSLLWQASGAQSSLSLSLQSLTQPIVLDDGVLMALYSGQLIYSDKNNGQPKWQISLDGEQPELSDLSYANLSSQIVVDNKIAFVPSSLGVLTKIDLNSGQEIWRKAIQDILSINKFGNLLVVTTNAQEIAGISSDTGEVFWVINLAQEGKGYKKPYNLLTPVMMNDKIYVFSTKGQMYKLSKEGILLEQFKIPTEVKFYAVNKEDIYLFSKRGIWRSIYKNNQQSNQRKSKLWKN